MALDWQRYQQYLQHLPYYTCCSGAYYILISIVILILLYWLALMLVYGYRNVTKRDMLNKRVITITQVNQCCSWWPISHFILFMILGFLFPTCDVLIIGAGILWEIIEMILYWILKTFRQVTQVGANSHLEYSDIWWAGSIKDIIADIFGFYIGKFYRIQWDIIREKYQK